MLRTVMIVDEAASMRGLVAMTLKKEGYEVVEASDGRDALTKLTGKKVDLIVSDLTMPHMDGIELIKAVKAGPQSSFIPIVMLTTESQDKLKREGQQAGAKAWIGKPFKPDVLVGVVKKIIG
jgi:two-component system chemotaxis response regulator CheY